MQSKDLTCCTIVLAPWAGLKGGVGLIGHGQKFLEMTQQDGIAGGKWHVREPKHLGGRL